jgi:hypothetical protein
LQHLEKSDFFKKLHHLKAVFARSLKGNPSLKPGPLPLFLPPCPELQTSKGSKNLIFFDSSVIRSRFLREASKKSPALNQAFFPFSATLPWGAL